ncbi:MAG: hypothetical protein KJ556_06935 [Gammaproteobacteria bacterium]|nr:hypothetical protein [Gammaproteobacteria bacterium]MBU2057243.1 hypothetical protein [Gammaproteobacteria bacterium]MBU2174845.1 hypothetical protein [Gammaproteobacteria bacterium]MBU2245450.1 hypothetical protein [Gammaproteobacteria bacterium]MBU2344231.1 hypothetical protein [Gammaproteobacteria bacterium]
MWEMVSVLAAMIVMMFLIELFDLPDWIRAHVKNGKTRKNLELKVEALQLQVQELERKVDRLSE